MKMSSPTVLLVNTNRMKPAVAPIGLDYLADSVNAAGHPLRLLDLCFSEDIAGDTDRMTREFAPGVIGVTVRNTDDCYFTSQAFFLPEIKEVIAMLHHYSAAPIVLGGVGYSVAPSAALDYCGADFGMIGEGEQAFVQFLQASQNRGGLDHVPGLVYREDGVIRQNPPRPADLAALPIPQRQWVDNARYFSKGGQAGFETKRGCPMDCIYCADPVAKGRTARLMPPARVVAELSALRRQGIDHFHTCDSEFNIPEDHCLEVCRAIIDAGLSDGIRWYAYCSPVPFHDEMAALFKRAGCAGINFGADSGSDAILRRLRRHFTAADLAATASICRRHGIPFMFDLLVGSPGETRDTIRQTIDLMRRLSPDCVGLSMGVRIYQGTRMAEEAHALGSPADHPNLYGAKINNPHFLRPVFYIAPGLGEDIADHVRETVAGDNRFFLPEPTAGKGNYNYNDNSVLVQAIENGARGAYWDILRRLRG